MMYLPVPSFSTASTSASTSATEKGRLIRRCPCSGDLFDLFAGTIAPALGSAGGTGTIARELVEALSGDEVPTGECTESRSLPW